MTFLLIYSPHVFLSEDRRGGYVPGEIPVCEIVYES
jgi:hypothetical protein